MSIKLRLILSYLAMLIVPLVASLIAAAVLLVVQLAAFQRDAALDPDFLGEMFENGFRVYTEVDKTIASNPDRLADPSYLDQLDGKLHILNSGIAVERANKIIYHSSLVKDQALYEALAAHGETPEQEDNHVIVNNTPYSFVVKEFKFGDNSVGKLFFFTDTAPLGRFAEGYFSSLFIAVMAILVITNGILTFWVSRSITKPLKTLKFGTEQIKAGNLDFELKNKSHDEIGEVCRTFEEMRQKLKASVEAQLQYEENRKELVSSISHDLKTPITSIKGYVEGIMDGVADTPEKMDRYIRTIYTKAADMDRLIDDLFLFSKLDLKKLPFDFEKVDITKYFEDCIEELSLEMEKKGINLALYPGVEYPVNVLADREKLKRVVMNIVGNAEKYMDKEKGKIEIRLKSDAAFVTVCIADNGKGITKEALPYIFDRFYRADASRNTSTGGSGLGLAIAKQIIENHGGRIWAESTVGEGTSICFTLKIHKESGEAHI